MRPVQKANPPIPPLSKGGKGGFSGPTTAAAALAWTVLAIVTLLRAPALAAEKPAPPMLTEDTATITELNYFSNFNISAYSLTIGTIEIRADKQGPPCPGTVAGQQIKVRYDNVMIFLGSEKPECRLRIRRMEFTGPPQPH